MLARVLRVGDTRAPDSAVIGAALHSGSAPVRRAGARVLAELAVTRRAAVLPSLRRLVGASDTSVAIFSAFGLGLAHDTISVPTLAARAGTRAAADAPVAAWALGEMGAPSRAQIARLLGSHASPRVTRALLLASARLRPLDFDAVVPHLRSSSPEIRWAAAYALARQRTARGARALLSAAGGDARFRAEVARGLTASVTGDSLRSQALARLRILSRDRDANVRIAALRSIATYGSVARDDLVRAIHDLNASVRITAAQGVGSALGGDSLAWQSLWAVDTTFKMRSSLIESAAAAGYVLPGGESWLTSPDWRRRWAAVGALAGARDSARARSVALTAARDSDGRVRAAAYEVLARGDTARSDSAVQALLAAALNDPDSVAREALPGYHAPHPDSTHVGRSLDWYENVVRRVIAPSLAGSPPRVRIATRRGNVDMVMLGADAPLTVFNFTTLASRGFYRNARFHRVVPAFVAQDGDPRGDGNGGPGYSIRDELSPQPYERGAVGMALSGPDTGGSQYFLTLTPQPHLDGHYTVFGRVTRGYTVMDSLVEGDAIQSIELQQ